MKLAHIFSVILSLTFVGGWVINLVEVLQMASDPMTTLFVIKAIGIFVGPLGAIMGLFF